MEHHYCALGDDRSWTDLITNLTHLSAARVDEDFDALMGWGSLPPKLLPGFLHELTHHWCFLSPVGFTLATLQLRARRACYLLAKGTGDTVALSERLWVDLSRYETVTTMLRPLAEGLALFAEFDAMSGSNSEILSTPSELTGAFFFNYGDFDPTAPLVMMFDSHRAPLMKMRGDYECFRRKRALLQQPLNTADGGYLPGYLTVRTLWLHLARVDSRLLTETDLAMTYLRSFFYDDDGLVHLMLRPWSGQDDSAAIVRYIAERFDTLARVQAHHLSDYEAALQALGRETSSPVALAEAILVEPVVAACGERLAQAMIADLETVDFDSPEGPLRQWDRGMMHHRDVMYLGSVEVADVHVDAEGACAITNNDGLTRRIPAAVDAAPGRAAGRIDIFFSALTDNKARAAVIYRGEDCVATSFGGPDELARTTRERFRHIASRAAIHAASEKMAEVMELVVDSGAVDSEEREYVRTMANGAAERIYGNMSTLELASEKKERAIARMMHDGFLDVLGWDETLIDGLTLISLAFSRRQLRGDVARELAERGIDLNELLSRLNECSQEYGSPLVMASQHSLLTVI